MHSILAEDKDDKHGFHENAWPVSLGRPLVIARKKDQAMDEDQSNPNKRKGHLSFGFGVAISVLLWPYS